MNIIIRKTKGTDAKSIYDILNKTWLVTYPNSEAGITLDDVKAFLEDKLKDKNLESAAAQFDSPNENWLYLVAEDADTGQIVGTLTVGKPEEYNKLKSIYILPEYQGQGIGRMFWVKTLEFFDHSKDTISRSRRLQCTSNKILRVTRIH